MMEYTIIKTFLNHVEADLAQANLAEVGILSKIQSDDGGGTMPHLSMANGVHLLVSKKDYQKAAQFLDLA